MRKLIALTAILTLTALTACGGSSSQSTSTTGSTTNTNTKAAETTQLSEHSYTYVDPSGYEYSGTYVGDWENNSPNGEGNFVGESDDGKLSLVGSWSNGQPNGQCLQTLKTDTGVDIYNGEFFYGIIQGSGSHKIEDSNGNLLYTYSGEFRDNRRSGNGEYTYYFTEEETTESGVEYEVYTGQFSNGAINGEGELIHYFVAETGIDRQVFTGQFTNGVLNGEGEQITYFTKNNVAELGFDRLAYAGQFIDGEIKEPYRYAAYNGNEVVEEGRVRDGRFVSDGEKAITDGLYDMGRELAGDGVWGFLYDAIAPSVYDRDAY